MCSATRNLDGESGSSMLREASAEGLLGSVGALMYTARPSRVELVLDECPPPSQ